MLHLWSLVSSATIQGSWCPPPRASGRARERREVTHAARHLVGFLCSPPGMKHALLLAQAFPGKRWPFAVSVIAFRKCLWSTLPDSGPGMIPTQPAFFPRQRPLPPGRRAEGQRESSRVKEEALFVALVLGRPLRGLRWWE